DIIELEANNEEFRAICTEEEQLTAFYEPCARDDDDAVYMKTTDILKSLSELSRLRYMSEQKLGKVLHRLQYPRFKHRGWYVYSIKRVRPA
ncbi:MAG: hypothetical protein FWF42_03410, partial [Streptococcaceae bacterium]|nr:hypothetical protein [Streptococcaceae bacterium]